jgi:hypothetical protein
MHIYMKVPQRNSLKQAKMSFFFLSKIREQEGGTSPDWRDWYWWEGEIEKEGEYGANMYMEKMISIKTILGMGDEREWWRR